MLIEYRLAAAELIKDVPAYSCAPVLKLGLIGCADWVAGGPQARCDGAIS